MPRWYDDNPHALKVFDMIKDLDEDSKSKLAENIIQVVNQIKNIKKEQDESRLSIGLEKVLGLYKSSNARRWYDQNEELASALRMLSAQPEEDFLNIMEGLYKSMNDSSLNAE